MSITYILQLFDENDDQHFDKYEIIKIMGSLSCKFDSLNDEVLKRFLKKEITEKINKNTENQIDDLENKRDSNS